MSDVADYNDDDRATFQLAKDRMRVALRWKADATSAVNPAARRGLKRREAWWREGAHAALLSALGCD